MDRSWTYLEGPGDDYDTRSMRSRSSSSIRRSELDRRHRRDRSVPRARAWDELPRSSSLRDLRRSASRSHSNHFWALDDFSAYRPWQWKPAAAAGQSTFEHDRPGTARHFLVTGGFTGTWRDGFPGVTMDGFCRNSGFTRKNFFDTGRQSHIPNFRQIATASPNRVRRIN
ncbi:unnamed protein product [Durusdinium trenchii]|uniref:Uncharacterized protein n=1 Tax=Durusdinium trenchii TaxID=1381693 RepID=A0ABP0M142_9DINO